VGGGRAHAWPCSQHRPPNGAPSLDAPCRRPPSHAPRPSKSLPGGPARPISRSASPAAAPLPPCSGRAHQQDRQCPVDFGERCDVEFDRAGGGRYGLLGEPPPVSTGGRAPLPANATEEERARDAEMEGADKALGEAAREQCDGPVPHLWPQCGDRVGYAPVVTKEAMEQARTGALGRPRHGAARARGTAAPSPRRARPPREPPQSVHRRPTGGRPSHLVAPLAPHRHPRPRPPPPPPPPRASDCRGYRRASCEAPAMASGMKGRSR
jgi:hypothetical protein